MEKETGTTTPEVKEGSEETVNDTQEAEDTQTEDTPDEPTVGELQGDEPSEKKKVESVPIARLNKEIERRKALEKELKEARAKTDTETTDSDDDGEPDVKQLAKELKDIKDREAQARREVAFEKNLNQTLENMPEYKELVNPAVIKQMAFNAANKDKTYRQLVEEAYGNALSGRPTTEKTTPRGGAKDTKVDIDRARNDTEYRREVLADPELRKQYNEGIETRIQL